MKKEQRALIWTALQYYIEMAEKERDMALELDDTDDCARYWEEQRIKAVEAKKALLKVR